MKIDKSGLKNGESKKRPNVILRIWRWIRNCNQNKEIVKTVDYRAQEADIRETFII